MHWQPRVRDIYSLCVHVYSCVQHNPILSDSIVSFICWHSWSIYIFKERADRSQSNIIIISPRLDSLSSWLQNRAKTDLLMAEVFSIRCCLFKSKTQSGQNINTSCSVFSCLKMWWYTHLDSLSPHTTGLNMQLDGQREKPWRERVRAGEDHYHLHPLHRRWSDTEFH